MGLKGKQKDKEKNSVLIYSPSEVVACVVLSAYGTYRFTSSLETQFKSTFVASQASHKHPRQVYNEIIRDALPLFDPAREKGVYWRILEGWWANLNAPAPTDDTASNCNLTSISSSSSIDKEMDKLTLLSNIISKHVPSTSDRFYEHERDRMKDRTREFDVSGYRETLGRILEGRVL